MIWSLLLIHSLAHAAASDPLLLTRQAEPIVLSRARFVGADYLIAGTAPALASRFGHAMLRLNFCAPDARPCLADDAYAIDIGFSAQVDSEVMSMVGAALGRYPSRLIATADLDLRTSYNENELRDLRAYPLHLDETAKDKLLTEVATRFWAAADPYRYLSNNCAGGVLSLLVATLPDRHPLGHVTALGLTPAALLRNLRALGLAGRIGPAWPSRRAGLEARMTEMRKIGLNVPATAEAYSRIPPTSRRAWIEAAADLADVMVLDRLEAFAARASRRQLLDAVFARAERRTDLCTDQYRRTKDAFAELAVERLKRVDGIPTSAEDLLDESEVRQRFVTLNLSLTRLIACHENDPEVRRKGALANLSRANSIRARERERFL